MKVSDISAWETFLSVAKHLSFSKAASDIKIPLAQVSKRISKLEGQLYVRLFQRTTRVVSLTEEGQALVPKISSILDDLKDTENLFESSDRVTGTIKVTCVPFIAHRLLLPVIAKFMESNPATRIELELSEGFKNIVEEGYDMAIRIESPSDTNLVYRKLAPNDLVLCASPEYLKSSNKKPTTIDDLKNQTLFMLSIHKKCSFMGRKERLGQFAGSSKIVCENGAFLTDMALRGMGIVVRSIWDVQDHLKSGRLVQVLKKYPIETFGHIYAVIPSKRYLTPRVRAFMDFIVQDSKHWSNE